MIKSMKRAWEDIENDLHNAEEELKTITDKHYKATEKVRILKDELEKHKINKELYHPMSELMEYKGRNISSIKLVERLYDGTLRIVNIYDEEVFCIDPVGRLLRSSHQSGAMIYDDKEQMYANYYWGWKTLHNFVGFLEIQLKDDNN